MAFMATDGVVEVDGEERAFAQWKVDGKQYELGRGKALCIHRDARASKARYSIKIYLYTGTLRLLRQDTP